MTKQEQTAGTILKTARNQQGRSMQQVADEVGITKSLLGAWELDQVAQPDPSRLTRLAGVLGIEANQLLKAAGYELDAALPTMKPYLRSKYKHLPPEARAEIQSAFDRISAKYGSSPDGSGPLDGQDE
ncbi:helix-turn-helix domain-containing protein [Pseudactinotalea sp. HY158]|uniref:helix-turn-helix domain-containing protein n=1 Tax=Pseudactinotalea sp. HY158 TaxID=2654547 RepID=UPI00129CAF61|nr:helix-turn-helix domain-containing protein [Pseudactinotalea sp. HY158]QGH68678.1 helix-turn-helix domain-containing protein [Pseudactinotalea sp. HY158]